MLIVDIVVMCSYTLLLTETFYFIFYTTN